MALFAKKQALFLVILPYYMAVRRDKKKESYK
jgi:hypothetical protein